MKNGLALDPDSIQAQQFSPGEPEETPPDAISELSPEDAAVRTLMRTLMRLRTLKRTHARGSPPLPRPVHAWRACLVSALAPPANPPRLQEAEKKKAKQELLKFNCHNPVRA